MMTENCNVRAKTYAFKRDDDTETKKTKGTKKCVIKHTIKFDDDKRLMMTRDRKHLME